MLATITAIIGIAGRGEERLGPRFLALEKIGRFRQPVEVVQPPRSDLLFVVEKAGRIRVIDHGQTAALSPSSTFAAWSRTRARATRWGCWHSPSPPTTPTPAASTFPTLTANATCGWWSIGRRPTPSCAPIPASARSVLAISEPTPKHHAGMLAFGPDGYLYIGSGDGGPSGDPNDVAQDRTVLLGKILRIDPNPVAASRRKPASPYRIPTDNPFVGQAGRDEIYAYGLRNPWRFSFDRSTGALAIGDVGNDRFEEIDYVTAGRGRGANFGWNAYEGRAVFRGGVPRARRCCPSSPIPTAGCAVTGGYVVRDPRLGGVYGRDLVGQYLFGDYCSGRLFTFRPHPDKAGKGRKLRFRIPYLTSFGEDSSGRIYVVSQRGPVWRLVVRRKRQ